MIDGLPPVTNGKNDSGVTEYHFWADSTWNGFDSLVQYLQKYWQAEVSEVNDGVYSRRWVLRSNGVPISVYHDSQLGNYFLREDGSTDLTLLEQIAADLKQRLSAKGQA